MHIKYIYLLPYIWFQLVTRKWKFKLSIFFFIFLGNIHLRWRNFDYYYLGWNMFTPFLLSMFSFDYFHVKIETLIIITLDGTYFINVFDHLITLF